MDDEGDMDNVSESEAECGLEELYYSAKEAQMTGGIEEAISNLETVVEMDVDRTKWGFKALKQIVKLLLQKDHQQAVVYYSRLLAYRGGSKYITTKDADKAFDSLWSRNCETAADADTRHSYCLTTVNLLQSFPCRLTRLKWLARLAQQCSSDVHQRQLESTVDDLQQVIQDACTNDDIISDSVKEYLVNALSMTTSLLLRKKRYTDVGSNLDRLKQFAEDEISKPIECQSFIKEMQARMTFARAARGRESALRRMRQYRLAARPPASASLSMLLPKTDDAVRVQGKDYSVTANYAEWTDECTLVQEILRCFNDDDLVRLRALVKCAEVKLVQFAAAELCGPLVRNRM